MKEINVLIEVLRFCGDELFKVEVYVIFNLLYNERKGY